MICPFFELETLALGLILQVVLLHLCVPLRDLHHLVGSLCKNSCLEDRQVRLKTAS